MFIVPMVAALDSVVRYLGCDYSVELLLLWACHSLREVALLGVFGAGRISVAYGDLSFMT